MAKRIKSLNPHRAGRAGGYVLITMLMVTAMLPLLLYATQQLLFSVRGTDKLMKGVATRQRLSAVKSQLLALSRDVDGDNRYETRRPAAGDTVPADVPVLAADEWGTAFSYVAWDPGSLNGPPAPFDVNFSNYNVAPPVVGLLGRLASAGENRTWQSNPLTAAAASGDDIFVDFYEAEAGTANTAGSGWVRDGASGTVRLITATDKVGIGTPTPGASLEVLGDLANNGRLITRGSDFWLFGPASTYASTAAAVKAGSLSVTDNYGEARPPVGYVWAKYGLSVLNGPTLLTRNGVVLDNGLYVRGQLEVRTTDASVPSIGFHRAGYDAVGLYETGGYLHTRSHVGAGGVLWDSGNRSLGAASPASPGANYTAATDGLVVAYLSSAYGPNTISGYAGGVLLAQEQGASVYVRGSITFPVRKGQAWSVQATGGTATVRWVALGTM